jgi:hypothetical protein
MLDLGKVRAALGDPGQLYNMGNALVLLGGIGGATFAAIGEGTDIGGAGVRVLGHFFGSPPSLALTAAMLVFFVSGKAYSQAWSGGGDVPDARLNQLGDILSGIGAVILGVGLTLLGGASLAVLAGAMNAVGKFGSAFAGTRGIPTPRGQILWADICKDLVLCSRVPALFAAVSGVVLAMSNVGSLGATVLSFSLVVSTVYWALADILLLRRNGPLMCTLRRLLPARTRHTASME